MKDESSGIAAYKEPRFAFPMGHGGAIRGGGMGSKKKKKRRKRKKRKGKKPIIIHSVLHRYRVTRCNLVCSSLSSLLSATIIEILYDAGH